MAYMFVGQCLLVIDEYVRLLRTMSFAFYVHFQMFPHKKRIFLSIYCCFARRWHSHAPLPQGAPLAER